MEKISKFWAWSLGIMLLWSVPVSAQPAASPWRSAAGATLRQEQVLDDLARVNVVYLAETHDRPADHVAQLQILQELYRRNPRLTIGMEMFQRPAQNWLNQYLAGGLTEAELQQQSEFDQRWGFPWEYYAPILRFAKEHHLPVLALNTPTEVTRQVARTGLSNLSQADRQWIPPIADLYLDDPIERQRLQEIYAQIHQGHSSSSSFEHFVLAQVLWDETMAQGIANSLTENSDRQVIVLVGQGHVVYGEGIPNRVTRRLPQLPHLEQRSILLNPEAEMLSEPAIANYFWVSPN